MSSLGVWLHGRRDALQDVVGMGWSDELFYNLLNMYHVLYFWIMKEMILLKDGLMYCLNVVIHLCRVQSQSYIHAGEVFILKRERERENQYSINAQTLARHLSTFILAIKRPRPQANLLCPYTASLQHHNALYLHRCLPLCVFTVPTLTSSQGIYSPHVGLFCVFRWCHLLCGLVRLRGSNIG